VNAASAPVRDSVRLTAVAVEPQAPGLQTGDGAVGTSPLATVRVLAGASGYDGAGDAAASQLRLVSTPVVTPFTVVVLNT
jgi:hypothetical protein